MGRGVPRLRPRDSGPWRLGFRDRGLGFFGGVGFFCGLSGLGSASGGRVLASGSLEVSVSFGRGILGPGDEFAIAAGILGGVCSFRWMALALSLRLGGSALPLALSSMSRIPTGRSDIASAKKGCSITEGLLRGVPGGCNSKICGATVSTGGGISVWVLGSSVVGSFGRSGAITAGLVAGVSGVCFSRIRALGPPMPADEGASMLTFAFSLGSFELGDIASSMDGVAITESLVGGGFS